MNPTIHAPIVPASRPALRPGVIAAVVGGGLLMTAAAALWAYYGTAVFYETILAGINACF